MRLFLFLLSLGLEIGGSSQEDLALLNTDAIIRKNYDDETCIVCKQIQKSSMPTIIYS